MSIPDGLRWSMPKRHESVRDPMFDLVRPIRAGLEIGSQAGWWARRFLRELPEAKLVCVDPWATNWGAGRDGRDVPISGEQMLEEWRMNTAFAGDRVQAHRLRSDDAVELFQPESMDLLFIDGCHQHAQVVKDLRNYWGVLRWRGALIVHDAFRPKVQLAMKKVFMRGTFSLQPAYGDAAHRQDRLCFVAFKGEAVMR